MGKQFHIGDILSVTTEKLLSPRGMKGIYDILNYLTGDDLFTRQLPKACDECKPYIQLHLRWVDDPEITVIAVGKLVLMLDTETGKQDPDALVTGWLSELSAKYGEMHELEPMSPMWHTQKDPLQELAEMTNKPVVVVTLPEEHN